ncbi:MULTISPECIES: hypothetical protein [Vibrio]|uniref:hypothetical protein n=1 Tax=Vibrio TaxID=662 RepID=UPI0002E140A3|nr:hypothetical protein [Vibrio tasmaniensis]OEF79135.1 hypothetical protein A162_15745 [Vibrio tasmaniensis 1F-155]PMO84565.1 hypothetical protein BCT01_24195 [Vibrio tasmaniensis]
MKSVFRSQLYNIEKQIVNDCKKRGHPSNEIKEKQIRLKEENFPDAGEKFEKSIHQMILIMQKIRISTDVLKWSDTIDSGSLSNPINNDTFQEAKLYVERLLDVDLSKVELVFADSIQYVDAGEVEGTAYANNDADHIVLLPKHSTQIKSTDLLIHELGHTADFTIARKTENDDLLFPHITFSETIAYYCQIRFLLEQGTREQRIGLFGAFYLTYLGCCVTRHCIETQTPLNKLKPNKALKSGFYDEILAAYPNSGINAAKSVVIKNITAFQQNYKDLGPLVNLDFARRFGFILALFLLDKPINFVKELIHKNSLEHDFVEIVQSIVPNFQDYANLDQRLLDFFDSDIG